VLGLLILIGVGIIFINRKIESSKRDYDKSEETEYSTVKEYLDLIIK
jgi:putative Mn2+ efflux pump MntP